ncbi:MAG: methyl-accepting chemotaxis protein [Methylococcaceae bacterium]
MFSNLFKLNEKVALTLMALMWSASLGYSWLLDNHQPLILTFLTLGSIISVWLWHQSNQHDKELLKKLVAAADLWRKGEVYARITQINGKQTELQKLAWSMNDLMDHVETAQVDLYYSMAYITYGDFSRRSYSEGLHGSFAHALKRLNSLTDVLSTTTAAIIDLMAAVSAGNFNKKVNLTVKGEYARVVDSTSQTMHMMQAMLNNVGEVMSNVAKGDISKRVHAEGQGDFAVLKNNVNLSLDALEGSLNDITRISNALSEGDLTQSIQKNYPGTFGKVISGMNSTVDNIKALVSEIKDSSEIITLAAKEIAAGNNDLSRRTEEQADSLEKTAANMEEFTSAVQKNSQSANHANELARMSSTIARNGVTAVSQVVVTMNGINESSKKIVDIISVIDGIAFQTNILALNAAVEAARAGDQGRGFAVVATEVRSLAQRAASAAGEIKNLIGDSVDKVQEGSYLAAKAGKTMEEILSSIQGVTNTISEITVASNEQSTSIVQVNQSLSYMDDVTQQNAALVEQASAAAKSLEEQTHNLSATVGNFKIYP